MKISTGNLATATFAASILLSNAQLQLCPEQSDISFEFSTALQKINFPNLAGASPRFSAVESSDDKIKVEIQYNAPLEITDDALSMSSDLKEATLDFADALPESDSSAASSKTRAGAMTMLAVGATAAANDYPMTGALVTTMGLISCAEGNELIGCEADFEVTLSLPEGTCFLGYSDNTVRLGDCDLVGITCDPKTIKEINNDSNGCVSTMGIVVNDKREARGGFYIQMTTDEATADSTVGSEGIYVYCGSNCDSMSFKEGDKVRITGEAGSFGGNNQIVPASAESPDFVVLCTEHTFTLNQDIGATSCERVNIPLISLPVESLSVYDKYSGMLVALGHSMYITDLYPLQFGKIGLSQGKPLRAETMQVVPGDEAQAQTERDELNTLDLDDGSSARCPEEYMWSFDNTNYTRIGNRIPSDSFDGTVTLTNDFGWTLIPTDKALETEFIENSLDRDTNPRVSNIPVPENNLATFGIRVSSLNVENYFTTLKRYEGEPDYCEECRGAENQAEFERQQAKLFESIEELDAAIFGLQEVQNNGQALGTFVANLNSFLGSSKYDYIDTGAIGSDVIVTAIIYQPALVNAVGDHATLQYTNPVNKSRPTVAQTFQVVGDSNLFTVAVNHFKSKGSACEEDDAGENIYGEGRCGAARLEHAQQLYTWIQTEPTGQSTSNILLLGDFNSHVLDRALTYLTETEGLIDLASRDIRYPHSYNFGGKHSTLDYGIASPSMAQVCGHTYEWNINADETLLIDYQDAGYFACGNKSQDLLDLFDASTPFRGSDHDPFVTFCEFGTRSALAAPVSGSGAEYKTIRDMNLNRDTYDQVDPNPTYLTRGIVVSDLRELRSAIHIQMTQLDASEDATAAASEGIYVWCGSNCFNGPTFKEGDFIQLEGDFQIRFDQPQLTADMSTATVLCDEHTAVLNHKHFVTACEKVNIPQVTLPVASLDDYNMYIGGLVEIVNDMYVTDLYTETPYGSVTLSQGGPLRAETMVVPAGDQVANQTAADLLRAILLDDGSTESCPFPQWVPYGGNDGVRVGYKLKPEDLSGLVTLNYAFSKWNLFPTLAGRESIPKSFDHTENPRVVDIPVPENDASTGGIRVASYNVENYFKELQETDSCSECRGADTPEEFEKQQAKIFEQLREIDAAVYGFQELQNDGGVTLTNLTSYLNVFLNSPGKYAPIDAGVVGNDAIACGIMYQPALVEPVGEVKTFDFTNPVDKSRTAVAQSFRVIGGSDIFTVVVNHLKSKGSECEEDEAGNSVAGEGNCGEARLTHAKQLHDFIFVDGATGYGTENVMILGDLNSHTLDRSMVYLKDQGWLDLAERDIPLPHSYSFSGKHSTLDYMMTTASMGSKCTSTFEWNVNADEIGFTDYQDNSLPWQCENKLEDAGLPETKTALGGYEEWFDIHSPFRASDHDPLITYCTFN